MRSGLKMATVRTLRAMALKPIRVTVFGANHGGRREAQNLQSGRVRV